MVPGWVSGLSALRPALTATRSPAPALLASSRLLSSTSSAPAGVPATRLAFDIAKDGSNQQSLEQPKNGVEYTLATMDKMVNWARQGSMWPMVSRACKVATVEHVVGVGLAVAREGRLGGGVGWGLRGWAGENWALVVGSDQTGAIAKIQAGVGASRGADSVLPWTVLVRRSDLLAALLR